MICQRTLQMLVCTTSIALSPAVLAQPSIGTISYWGTDTALYNRLPVNSLALINPDNGIFVSANQSTTLVPNLASFRAIVDQQAQRGVKMLGYVPTGYFNHGCNQNGVCQTWTRIEAQIKNYFSGMPSIAGIFFDEVSPSNWNCSAFPAEYKTLRDMVNRYRPGATIAFNAGVPDNCVVAGVNAGEIAVLFESDYANYLSQANNISVSTRTAQQKGVKVWHLVHTAKTSQQMEYVINTAKSQSVDYVYVTDIGGDWQAGENTWGSLPVYWEQEVSALGNQNAGGVDWGNQKVKLVSAGNYLCLRGASGYVDQQKCKQVDAWALNIQKPQGGGNYYQLKYGSLCATQSASANRVTHATCNTSLASQQWSMKEAGGLVYFQNRSSGQVLGIQVSSSGATTVTTGNYQGLGYQHFYFQ